MEEATANIERRMEAVFVADGRLSGGGFLLLRRRNLICDEHSASVLSLSIHAVSDRSARLVSALLLPVAVDLALASSSSPATLIYASIRNSSSWASILSLYSSADLSVNFSALARSEALSMTSKTSTDPS